MALTLDVTTKTAARLDTLARRLNLEPEQVAEEAVALAAANPEALERWLNDQTVTLATE